MIVEFIGCTGSGKTTLIGQVRSRLAQTTQVLTAHDLIAGRVGLGRVSNPTAQNLIEEVVCFPFFLRSLPRHRDFLAHTFRLSTHSSHSALTTLSNIRSLVRKIGGYELVLRHDRQDTIILVDEGPIQAAHMFAANATSMGAAELDHFADLLPLPHIVVYVECPVGTLVERTLHRPDPPREVRSRSRADTATYIAGAVTIFHRLVRSQDLQSRALVVENAGRTQQEYEDPAEQVAQHILSRGPAHYLTIGAEQLIPGVS